ncbi:DapH/DapD/GlmU-related protein [Pontibacter sp. G13]|uniref:DapH/DapD/GlmU-related protein n=1 Tax=Pontibacter sp. G13 TaxID=3074898 RepID=UPI00288A234F|nr:DapH/DapD/GlmU-related protein [Pontibacter sp. G13]WNJ21457.1 DapH/DapD/GlmU-related protein [Pontibacter sp. G13]
MEESKTPILIVGHEAEARLALEIANSLDVLVFGFLTDDSDMMSREINDILVVAEMGSKDQNTLLSDEHVKWVVAEADSSTRRDYVDQIKGNKADTVNLMHASFVGSEFAKMGKGNILGAQTVLEPNAEIGDFNWIDARCYIGPDVQMGDFCTLQAGALIGKGAELEDDVFVGIGAVIHPGVKVGKGAMVAAGSIVLRDVEEGASVFGNPAEAIG